MVTGFISTHGWATQLLHLLVLVLDRYQKSAMLRSDPEPYLLINAVCGGERIKQRYDLPCRQDHIWKLDIVLNKKDHLVHGSC